MVNSLDRKLKAMPLLCSMLFNQNSLIMQFTFYKSKKGNFETHLDILKTDAFV